MELPNFRVGHFSTFFDTDLTYFRILQDVFTLLSFVALTWDLLDSYEVANGSLTPPQRLHGLSLKTLIIYAITFSVRLAEYFPFDYFSYDSATCTGFACIFWIATLWWVYFDSLEQKNALPEQPGQHHRPLLMNTRRPIWLHVIVAVTAVLAYFHNYNHLTLTPQLFMFAWSHYLDGVAMLPQMWILIKTSDDRYAVSRSVRIGVDIMALSKILQLIDWTYLFIAAEMLDVLAVGSAIFHVASYVIFRFIVIVKSHILKKKMSAETREETALFTVSEVTAEPPRAIIET